MDDRIDVLMITYRWPKYVRLSLPRLLETCDESMHVWLWHNGSDTETLETVSGFARHPSVAAFHHSPTNRKLTEPTNWMWSTSTAAYLSKVDDDCLLEPGWAGTLRSAHMDVPDLGVIGSWRFYEDDFNESVAKRKIEPLSGGHQVMRNAWVQGSGYLMKRRCIEDLGLLRSGQSFTAYCIELAHRGYVNGWYFPFIHEEHLDDPRSPLTGLLSDQDLQDRRPLSARLSGAFTLDDWDRQMRSSAQYLQAADPDPRKYRGWRRRLRAVRERLKVRL